MRNLFLFFYISPLLYTNISLADCRRTLTVVVEDVEVGVHDVETADGPILVSDELRPLARNFAMAFSAWSALSSLSSRSCCTLRYLARLIAAISSYTPPP